MRKERTMNNKGFTLIELLVAITIIAVLTVVGAVSYAPINKRSRDTRRKNDLQELRQQLEMFRTDMGFYPAVNTSGFATVNNLNTGNSNTGLVSTYTPAIVSDPSINAYYYYATGASGGNYYGYCVCGMLETLTSPSNSCTGVTLPAGCNYSLRNP